MFRYLYDGVYHTKTTKTYLRSLGMDEDTVESIQSLRDFELEKEKEKVRLERDKRLSNTLDRINRYRTQLDTPDKTTDDSEQTYLDLLTLAQQLRDVPQQKGFPYSVEWP